MILKLKKNAHNIWRSMKKSWSLEYSISSQHFILPFLFLYKQFYTLLWCFTLSPYCLAILPVFLSASHFAHLRPLLSWDPFHLLVLPPIFSSFQICLNCFSILPVVPCKYYSVRYPILPEIVCRTFTETHNADDGIMGFHTQDRKVLITLSTILQWFGNIQV